MLAPHKEHYTVSSGSDSSTSGSSSITANVVSQDEAEGGMQMPVAAQQDILPPLDRPLPIRKRQRKPCKKGKTVQAEAPCSPAPTQKRKRGRKPKASNKTGAAHSGVSACVLGLLRWHSACAFLCFPATKLAFFSFDVSRCLVLSLASFSH